MRPVGPGLFQDVACLRNFRNLPQMPEELLHAAPGDTGEDLGKDDRDGCQLRKSVVDTLEVAFTQVIKVVLLCF